MKSKARFIPLIVLGAIVLSLIAVIPALSATGQLQFGHGSTVEEWAKQDGEVELQVTDTDLDQPIKYVLLPGLDIVALVSEDDGTADGTLESAFDLEGLAVAVVATSSNDTIMVGSTSLAAGGTDGVADDIQLESRLQVGLANEDNVPGKLFVGDTILVELVDTGADRLGETVRQVTAITPAMSATTTASVSGDSDRDGVVYDAAATNGAQNEDPPSATRTEVIAHYVTLNHPLSKDFEGATAANIRIYKVINSNATASKCPTCALAPTITDPDEIDNGPVMDSGLRGLAAADTDGNLAAGDESNDFYSDRFSGTSDGRVNNADVLVVTVGALTGTVDDPGDSTYDIDGITTNTGADLDAANDEISGAAGRLLFWGSDMNTTANLVQVRSSADSTWRRVVLTETQATGGVFQAMITLTDEDSDDDFENKVNPSLRVNDSGRVTMRYNDGGTRRTASIDVESTEPVLSNFSPAHNTSGLDARPDVSADVTDSDSGVVKDKVYVVFATLDGGHAGKPILTANDEGGAPHSVQATEDGRLSEVTGGYNARVRMPSVMERNEDTVIAWWVVAYDKADNVQVSDQNTADDSTCDPAGFLDLDPQIAGADSYGDPVEVGMLVGLATVAIKDGDGNITADDEVAGCQPFLVKVDSTSPALDSAETGVWWDSSKDGGDKTESDPAKAKNTSIVVVFSEALDGSTVSASDFEVDDTTPLDAAHYGGAASSVFLTVDALEPGETPKVELVGEVADPAGNIVDSGVKQSDETEDGIAPSLTVTLAGVTSGARPVTDSKIVVTIETDENTANPDVYVHEITSVDSDGKGMLKATSEVIPTPKVKGPRSYETTFTAPGPGLYNVYVEATDGSNPGAAGVDGMDPVDLSGDTKALLFEVDNAGPTFTLDPPSSDDPNAFIRINFDGEANENPIPVGTSTTDMKDVDSYAMVTIVSATLAGDDISGDLERLGDNSFLLVAPNLEIGEHKIEIEAEDTAGNSETSSQTLEITERKPFVLSIRAGVSLISFPGDPLDPDINSVFPSDHPVQEVATYDPTQPGLWFAARRDETTGMLDGNLPNISGSQAYLVRSSSTRDVKVIIDRPSSHDLLTPPQIDLVAGWNLVPVTDITFKLTQNTVISYDHYFGENDAITRVYGVDTVANRLILVQKGGDLKVGMGYWVFASSATSIAPGVTPPSDE